MPHEPLIQHFSTLLEYESWATARTLDAIDSVPPANRRGDVYTRALGLVPHNLIAGQVWLWRLMSTPHANPTDWFPAQPTADTRTQAQKLYPQFSAYFESLRDADLAREIHYNSSDGNRFSSRVADVLTHVFNHSTYHRGQVARLVTECGGQRAATDFIFFSRKNQSSP